MLETSTFNEKTEQEAAPSVLPALASTFENTARENSDSGVIREQRRYPPPSSPYFSSKK